MPSIDLTVTSMVDACVVIISVFKHPISCTIVTKALMLKCAGQDQNDKNYQFSGGDEALMLLGYLDCSVSNLLSSRLQPWGEVHWVKYLY